MKRTTGTLAFLLPGGGLSAASQSEQRVSTTYSMPARVETWLRVSQSSSLLGPVVSLQASLVLPGLQTRVTLRNRALLAVAPPEDVTQQIQMVPPGERVTRAGQPVRGMPASSTLTLKVCDFEGHPLAEERDLGTCEDGFRDVAVPCLVDVSAVAWVTGLDWSERRGPRVRLSGELAFSRGVVVRLGVHGSRNGASGALEGGSELPLLRPGMALYSPEKTLEGSGPSSTWVSVRFLDTAGRPIGEEHVVGRCVMV